MTIGNIRNNYSPVQHIQSKTEAFSLENLVEMTVINLARDAKRTVSDFLNGFSLSTIVARIKEHAASEKDVNAIIFLTINHADNLIHKYSREGHVLNFADLVAIKRDNPQASIVSVFTYALAKKNPQLAQFAETVLDTNNDIKSKVVDNPMLGFTHLSRQIQFVDIKTLKAQDIYTATNTADAEAAKYRQGEQEKQTVDTRKQNHTRLANMQIALRLQQANKSDVKNAEYRTNFLARA